jgi:hypothetical protein
MAAPFVNSTPYLICCGCIIQLTSGSSYIKWQVFHYNYTTWKVCIVLKSIVMGNTLVVYKY